MRFAPIVLMTIVIASGSEVRAQSPAPDSYRQLTGTVMFGWLDSEAHEIFDEQTRNPFSTLRLDFRDAIVDPTFLSYRIRPVASFGFQDAFSGLSDGTGIAAEGTFLSARPWPFRFHYSRLRRSALTAGLTSSYVRLPARNDDSTLGAQWRFAERGRPSVDVSFSKVAISTRPEAAFDQGFDTRSKTLALGARDQRWGWSMNGSAELQRIGTAFLATSAQGAFTFDTTSRIGTVLLQAQRPLGGSVTLSLLANRTSNRSEFGGGSLRQQFDSYSAKVEYKPGTRISLWTQGRLTDSELESRSAPVSGGSEFVLPPTHIENRVADSEARVQLLPTLSAFGRLEFTSVGTAATARLQQAGNFVTSIAGLQYAWDRRWFAINGSYYVSRHLTSFAADTDSRALGHGGDASVSLGDPRIVRATGGYSITRSREDVRTFLPFRSNSERARLRVEKSVFGAWLFDAHWEQTTTGYERETLRSDFRGRSFGGSATARGLSVSYARSYGHGDSLQPFINVLDTSLPGSPILLVLGSGNSSTTAAASWHLTTSLLIRGVWRDQTQSIGASLASRIEEREATLTWPFRQLRVEAGYVMYRFDFGSPAFRRSLVLRVTRGFRVF